MSSRSSPILLMGKLAEQRMDTEVSLSEAGHSSDEANSRDGMADMQSNDSLRESDGSINAESLEALLEDEEDDEIDGPQLKRQRSCEAAEGSDLRMEILQDSRGGLFRLLPEELAMQMLERLSAVDLTSVSQTCRFFRRIARGNELWRALYSCRWGEAMKENNALLDQPSWKVNYMERDAQNGERMAKMFQDKSILTSYLQSLVAERHMKPPSICRTNALPSNKALWGRITRWRGLKGLLKCPSPALGSQHLGCPKKGPFTELLGSLFLCESCGWAHSCGEGCSEKLVDEVSESLVCPVSGRCFDRMIQDWEIEGREDQEVEAGCDFGVAGHWGRAYSVGYNCSSEEELRRHCGVVI